MTYGAGQAVGTHYGPTWIHWADYSLRHQRDGSTGTTMLYHLRIYCRTHSLSVMTTGRRSCWSMGTAAASARVAGPFRDYWPAGAAGGLSPSAPRQADGTTTRPSWIGPTRQSNVRDSESDYLLRLTRHGQGMVTNLQFRQRPFYQTINVQSIGIGRILINRSFFLSNGIFCKI